MLFQCIIINLYDEKLWVIKSHDYFFLCQSVNGFLFWHVWLTMWIIQRFYRIRNGMLQEYSFKFIEIIQIFVLCSWIWRKNTHLKFKQLFKTIWVKPLIKGKFSPFLIWINNLFFMCPTETFRSPLHQNCWHNTINISV